MKVFEIPIRTVIAQVASNYSNSFETIADVPKSLQNLTIQLTIKVVQ